MKKFMVFLRGDNFLITMDGGSKKVGFYTTRYVEAEGAAAAEQCAVDLLRNNTKLRDAILNSPSDPPLLFAEEVKEIGSFEGLDSLEPGLVFFDDALSRN